MKTIYFNCSSNNNNVLNIILKNILYTIKLNKFVDAFFFLNFYTNLFFMKYKIIKLTRFIFIFNTHQLIAWN